MSRDFDEKRDFIRMLLEVPLHCKDPDTGETLTGQAHDLSSKGVAFVLDRPYDPGKTLEVRIRPEKSLVPPLHARVEVVRVEPDISGRSFRIGARILEYL